MNPADHAWWLASRASGIVAMLLLTATVFIGLTLSTRVLKGPGLPKWLSTSHEQLALASLVAIALHGVTLLGDPFLKPSLADIAIPFASDYRPVWTGLGVAGGYIVAALSLSYYIRKRIGGARWRKLHRFTTVGYVMSVGHTIGAGTDSGWLTYAVIAPAGPILVLLVQRIAASRSRAAPKPAPGTKPAPKPTPASPAAASQGS